MTSATEELRRLLDERGVEWGANDTYRLLVTLWNDASGHSWVFMEHRDGSFSKLTAYHLTPEQAIAATLGSGTCKNKATNSRTFWCECCDCALEAWIDVGGKLINGLRYCPNCGRRVIDDRQGD